MEHRGIRGRRDLVVLEVRIDPVFDLVSALTRPETHLTARQGTIDIRIAANDPRMSLTWHN